MTLGKSPRRMDPEYEGFLPAEVDVLRFTAATKRFGTAPALDGCSFDARPGRLTGFLGPNGAGKTTAMRAVFGLVQLDSGEVIWRGAPITTADREHFGYMPEERGLYPRMRVRDQLTYLGRLCGSSAKEARATTDSWLERLGLDSRAQDQLDALSHGNQQRVQLIAALINEPELLVLDEPFSGLDPLAMQTMAELLREIAADGAAVLFSSHQLDLVEHLCEDVVIIDHGRVVLSGGLDDLRAAVPQRFLEIHFRGSPADWSVLPSIAVLGGGEKWVRLLINPQADLPGIVEYVRRNSDVVSLSYQPPTLSELFHQAVAA